MRLMTVYKFIYVPTYNITKYIGSLSCVYRWLAVATTASYILVCVCARAGV